MERVCWGILIQPGDLGLVTYSHIQERTAESLMKNVAKKSRGQGPGSKMN